jgi:hypothetical protein
MHRYLKRSFNTVDDITGGIRGNSHHSDLFDWNRFCSTESLPLLAKGAKGQAYEAQSNQKNT